MSVNHSTVSQLELAIVEAIRLGLDGEAIAGIDSLIDRFPRLAELADSPTADRS